MHINSNLQEIYMKYKVLFLMLYKYQNFFDKDYNTDFSLNLQIRRTPGKKVKRKTNAFKSNVGETSLYYQTRLNHMPLYSNSFHHPHALPVLRRNNQNYLNFRKLGLNQIHFNPFSLPNYGNFHLL